MDDDSKTESDRELSNIMGLHALLEKADLWGWSSCSLICELSINGLWSLKLFLTLVCGEMLLLSVSDSHELFLPNFCTFTISLKISPLFLNLSNVLWRIFWLVSIWVFSWIDKVLLYSSSIWRISVKKLVLVKIESWIYSMKLQVTSLSFSYDFFRSKNWIVLL